MTTIAAPGHTEAAAAPRRRMRPWLVIGAVAIAVVVLGLLVVGTAAKAGPALGASNPAPAGSQALLSVLKRHGVDVHPVATLDEARSAASDPADTTVALYDPDRILGGSRLDSALALGSHLVLIAPSPQLRAAASASGARVDVISSAATVENGHIADDGHAARAIRLLGGTPTLLWYLPSPADVAPGGVIGIADAAPGWVTPVALLGIAVAIAAAVWRGRRFGALVIEPLPVIVRSRESMEGRARLYQRSNARLHALDALRMGTIARLTPLLGLPSSAEATTVADAAAAALGADPASVRALLLDAVPGRDAELIDLSDGLAAIERDVRDALHGPHRRAAPRTEG